MKRFSIFLHLALALAFLLTPISAGQTFAAATQVYLVVLAGTQLEDGTFLTSGSPEAVLDLVNAAGGTVTADLSSQIGVLVVESANGLFSSLLLASPLIDDVGQDYSWKAFQSYEEALNSGDLVAVESEAAAAGDSDPLEAEQWSMQQIHTQAAHSHQDGRREVQVGILDTGIDGLHLDFDDDGVAGGSTNVDCASGREFVSLGPGIGNPDPCVDNGYHGTHVAGIVAAQRNGHGVAGVAPGVTLVPVKVCDTMGLCYASAVVAGVTYAGDASLEVINMSFFVDDMEFNQGTEFKCWSDPTQRSFRKSVDRALKYARGKGVTLVAAVGNSDTDLANPPAGKNCEVIPAESGGVVGTMALGPNLEKASYSSYGYGSTDVAAPGGNGQTGVCTETVLSTIPGNAYACFKGTSMASPHTAGVAALIISQFGRLAKDGDIHYPPAEVDERLFSTTVDLGLKGYDECFGHGRIDALRAVLHDDRPLAEQNPACPEYTD